MISRFHRLRLPEHCSSAQHNNGGSFFSLHTLGDRKEAAAEDEPTIPLDAETENSGEATEDQPTMPLDAVTENSLVATEDQPKIQLDVETDHYSDVTTLEPTTDDEPEAAPRG